MIVRSNLSPSPKVCGDRLGDEGPGPEAPEQSGDKSWEFKNYLAGRAPYNTYRESARGASTSRKQEQTYTWISQPGSGVRTVREQVTTAD